MQEHDIQQALRALKVVAREIRTGNQTAEAVLDKVFAVFAEKELQKIVGPALVAPLTQPGEVTGLIAGVLAAIERAGFAPRDDIPEARLPLEIGEILYVQGSWDEALSRYEKARTLSQTIDYAEGQSRALRQIGRIKRRRGDWSGASDAYEEVLSLDRTLDNAEGMAESLLNLGNIHYEQGLYSRAESLLEEALVVCERLTSNLLNGDIALSLGVIRLVQGHDEEAIIHFTESLAHFEILGDQRRVGQACHNLGMAYATQGMWDRAGVMYERAMDIARQNNEWCMVGPLYLCRGEMQAHLSDPSMAMGYAQKALEIFERLKDPLGQADAYKLYGRIAGLKTAWSLAHELLAESVRLHSQHGSRLGEAEVEEVRGWVYERQQNYSMAMQTYQQAMTIYNDLKVLSGARRVRDAILHLEERTF